MTHEYQCKRFTQYADVWEYDGGYGPGAFTWYEGDEENWDGEVLLIRLPDGLSSLYVHTNPNATHPNRTVWHWDGDKDNSTLNPSILNPDPGGWHGWLRAGKLISA